MDDEWMEESSKIEETKKRAPKRMKLNKMPDKFLQNLFKYLDPVDCYNLSQASVVFWQMVKKQARFELSSIFLRFDDERSCVAVYFRKARDVGRVFYSWKRFGQPRVYWCNSYEVRSSKMHTQLFTSRTHPKEVRTLQSQSHEPVNYVNGVLYTYQEVIRLFKGSPYHFIGVNVNCRKTCQRIYELPMEFPMVCSLRLIATGPAKRRDVNCVMKKVKTFTTIRVAHQVGPVCMHDILLNAHAVQLDDPEWLTCEQLVAFKNSTLDIGHNNLNVEEIKMFFWKWMFLDPSPVRCTRLEITLSPETFNNKHKILQGVPSLQWDPKMREGEFFETAGLIKKHKVREPHFFFDCKNATDILRYDGTLGSVIFHGKRLYFLVWKDRFPYRTLVKARNALKAKELQKKRDREWKAKCDWLEEQHCHVAEERAAKRKYFDALREFIDTEEEPERKRSVLSTISIFKEDKDSLPA